jgi:hypothetical protein
MLYNIGRRQVIECRLVVGLSFTLHNRISSESARNVLWGLSICYHTKAQARWRVVTVWLCTPTVPGSISRKKFENIIARFVVSLFCEGETLAKMLGLGRRQNATQATKQSCILPSLVFGSTTNSSTFMPSFSTSDWALEAETSKSS